MAQKGGCEHEHIHTEDVYETRTNDKGEVEYRGVKVWICDDCGAEISRVAGHVWLKA